VEDWEGWGDGGDGGRIKIKIRNLGEEGIEEFEEFVDLGELGLHGGADFSVGGHDAHDLQKVVAFIFGKGELLDAVVGLGDWRRFLLALSAGGGEGEFFGEAGVDFFGGGGEVEVGEAGGEEVGKFFFEVGGEDILGEVLALGEA